jgi:hypothetical protein
MTSLTRGSFMGKPSSNANRFLIANVRRFLVGVGIVVMTMFGTKSPTLGQVIDTKASAPAISTPLALTMSRGACVAPPPQAAGYCLKFSADFNPLNLSPNGLGSFTWYNPGMWWESPAPYNNIFVRDSTLNLVWRRGQSTADTSVSTAAQDGSYYQAWHYGYFEVRMRWDPVVGAWPAIWMIPIQDITNPGGEEGELDIFEGQGSTPDVFYGTIHDWVGNQDVANNNCCNAYQLPGTVHLSQFHTYGVLWTPGHLTWYFDNQPLNTVATYAIFDDLKQKYYLILGSQEGANWTSGDTSGVSASSIWMQVDWVHVWQ